MRTRIFRQAGLGAFLLAAGLAAATHASAEQVVVHGSTLVLNDTLSEDTIITTNPSLNGEIHLQMEHSSACLRVSDNETAAVTTSGCSEDGKLNIEMSPDTRLILNTSGDGTITIGDLNRTAVVNIGGSGNIHGGRVGGLTLTTAKDGDANFGLVEGSTTLDMTGTADVKLAEIRGSLVLRHVGSGDVTIGRISAGHAVFDSSGSGDVIVGPGSIATIQARLSGAGDLSVAASVHTGEVTASGGGDIKLGTVTGTLQRSSSGGSDIIVGGSKLVDTIAGKVATAIADSTSGDDRPSHLSNARSAQGFVHFLTVIFVGFVLYMVYRIVRRAGGVSGFRSRMGASSGPEAPLHPGVLSLVEKMTGLDQRLGRVESYVTSREFDLHRKFRDLGK